MLQWLPENVSTYGHRIDEVLQVIYYIVGAWFVLAEAVLFYFVFRYRKKEGVSAVYQPGVTIRSLAWVLVPVALVVVFDIGIDFIQSPGWKEIKMSLPPPDQVVRVKGRQFVWEITHAGRDGKLDTADDIQTLNQLTVPVRSKIQLELEARDVIHSLWIPNLRFKQDVVPGRTFKGWFEATKVGTYGMACAELCGSGHGIMKGELHVLSQVDYARWLEENRAH